MLLCRVLIMKSTIIAKYIMVASIFSASPTFALFCPSHITYNLETSKYAAPLGWCWSLNQTPASCLSSLSAKSFKTNTYWKPIFLGAVFTTSLQSKHGKQLAGKALCSYMLGAKYVLYSKRPVNFVPSENWVCYGLRQNNTCTGLGWYCKSNNPFDCPF